MPFANCVATEDQDYPYDCIKNQDYNSSIEYRSQLWIKIRERCEPDFNPEIEHTGEFDFTITCENLAGE